MGAIKQLAAVSISPMHQETSARRDEFACRDATFVETIEVDIGSLIFLVNPTPVNDRSFARGRKRKKR